MTPVKSTMKIKSKVLPFHSRLDSRQVARCICLSMKLWTRIETFLIWPKKLCTVTVMITQKHKASSFKKYRDCVAQYNKGVWNEKYFFRHFFVPLLTHKMCSKVCVKLKQKTKLITKKGNCYTISPPRRTENIPISKVYSEKCIELCIELEKEAKRNLFGKFSRRNIFIGKLFLSFYDCFSS